MEDYNQIKPSTDLDSFNAPTQTSEPHHNIPKLAFVLFIALLTIALVSSVAIYLGKERKVSSSTPAMSKTTTTVGDPTADWKTYRNKEFGFEFKYPSDFSLEEKTNLIILRKQVPDGDYIVIETHSDEDMTLQDYGIHHLQVSQDHEFTYTELGGYTALKTSVTSREKNTKDIFTRILYGTYLHVWHADVTPTGSGNITDEIFNKILLSFNLFNPPVISFEKQQIDVSNWKSYSNQEYEISFKYDPDWIVQEAKNPVIKKSPFPIQANPEYMVQLGHLQTIDPVGYKVDPYFAETLSISKFVNIPLNIFTETSLYKLYEGLGPNVQRVEKNGKSIYTVTHGGSQSGDSLEVFILDTQDIYNISVGNNASIYYAKVNAIVSTLTTSEFSFTN